MNNDDLKQIKPRPKKVFKLFNVFFLLFFLGILAYYLLAAPNNNKDLIIHISKNQSLDSIAEELALRDVIRHDYVLKFLIKILNFDHKITPGDYLFAKDKNAFNITWQIAQNRHNILPVKITIKEGMTNNEIADLLSLKLALFRRDLFLSNEKSKQGYLFPDTYFIFNLATTDEIISQFNNNFNQRIKTLENDLSKSNNSKKDIIIMASLLEREAKGSDDQRIISGILWKRISIGMPLQVDVDKSTYTIKGLPEAPINNPGLASIKAALYPIDSMYLFYLHDKTGQVHLARNFEEHKKNINQYLR